MKKNDFEHTYEMLTVGNPETWEIYAGEEATEMAVQRGIPQEKWEADRVRMQLGQEMITRFVARGNFDTTEKQEQEIRNLISCQIDSKLQALEDDFARRGMLLQAFQFGQSVNEQELVQLSQMELSELRKRVEDRVYRLTLEEVVPILLKQCEQILKNNDTVEETTQRNSAAMATAAYLENEAARDYPEILGSAAAAACNQRSVSRTLEDVAMCLIVVAALIVCLYLFAQTTGVLLNAGIHLAVEHTAVGMGVVMAEEAAVVTEVFAEWLVFSLGSAIVGSMLCGVSKIIEKFSGDSVYIEQPYHYNINGLGVEA